MQLNVDNNIMDGWVQDNQNLNVHGCNGHGRHMPLLVVFLQREEERYVHVMVGIITQISYLERFLPPPKINVSLLLTYKKMTSKVAPY